MSGGDEESSFAHHTGNPLAVDAAGTEGGGVLSPRGDGEAEKKEHEDKVSKEVTADIRAHRGFRVLCLLLIIVALAGVMPLLMHLFVTRIDVSVALNSTLTNVSSAAAAATTASGATATTSSRTTNGTGAAAVPAACVIAIEAEACTIRVQQPQQQQSTSAEGAAVRVVGESTLHCTLHPARTSNPCCMVTRPAL